MTVNSVYSGPTDQVMVKAGLLFLILLVAGGLSPVFAQGVAVYAPPLGSGDALSLGVANTGVALDSGLTAGRRNPSGYLTSRNELTAEGDLWGSISVQSGAGSPDFGVGAGMIGYLSRIGKGSFVLAYIPRVRMQTGAKYPSSEILGRLSYSDLEAAYAWEVGAMGAFGVSVRWINGRYTTGVSEANVPSLDTFHNPTLFEVSAGYRRRAGLWRWGAVLESPAYGKMVEQIPANVGVRRDKHYLDFNGAWGGRVGTGWTGGAMSVEGDISLRLASDITRSLETENGTTKASPILDGRGTIIETGVAFNSLIGDGIRMYSGLRFRSGGGDSGSFVLAGLGASYELNEDLTITGGCGLMLPAGGTYNGTPLEDMHPFDLRAGIIYHGD